MCLSIATGCHSLKFTLGGNFYLTVRKNIHFQTWLTLSKQRIMSVNEDFFCIYTIEYIYEHNNIQGEEK